ncbi:hypothetical protein E2562_022422 [Oryza meyeriana var. granulata]|uniref:Disease resistance N-terminal domain-containing protein n=1 Tax=Oryza meyeriana var. granulata TaxID=110450 RepID=A0A6G1BMX3_9ORYZ|nr:hypothetical protein E2562_022422 [Oryza meyeriana var. granulata]
MAPLLAKLATLLGDRCYKLKGVRKDIQLLRSELTEMNVLLEKLADMEQLDGQQKLWRDNVREMAYDIKDCIVVFMYHLGDGDNRDGLLQKTIRKVRKLRVRYQIATKIQELKARVMEVAERRNRYIGLGKVTSSSKVVEVDPRLPALYEAAENLVGIDGPREEIAWWLMEEGESVSSVLELPNGIEELVSLQTLFAFDVGTVHFLENVIEKRGGDKFADQKSRDLIAIGVIRASRRFCHSINCDMPTASLLNICSPNLGDCLPDILVGAQKTLHQLIIRKSIRTVPEWMAQSDKLTMLELRVEEPQSADIHDD